MNGKGKGNNKTPVICLTWRHFKIWTRNDAYVFSPNLSIILSNPFSVLVPEVRPAVCGQEGQTEEQPVARALRREHRHQQRRWRRRRQRGGGRRLLGVGQGTRLGPDAHAQRTQGQSSGHFFLQSNTRMAKKMGPILPSIAPAARTQDHVTLDPPFLPSL